MTRLSIDHERAYCGGPLTEVFRGATLAARLGEAARRHRNVRQNYWSDGAIEPVELSKLHAVGLRLASALRDLGVRRGDVIAVQMPNSFETAVAYRACFNLGAVLAPVVHISGSRELGFIVRQSGAKVLIVRDRWRSTDFRSIIGAIGDCPALEHVVIVGDASTCQGAIGWQRLLNDAGGDFLDMETRPSDPSLLLYTSGTTADPKGVLHTSNSLLSELDQRIGMGDDPAATTFSAWPAGHIGGFASLIYPQVTGASSVVMDRWEPNAAVGLLERYRVSRTTGVPVYLTELLDRVEAGIVDLSMLRSYMTGAASVAPSIVERAQHAGISVFRCYGCSEHPTISSGRPSDSIEERAYTDGQLMPGTKIRLVDDNDADVGEGEEGEIVTRGAELFDGYTDPALAEGAFVEGWYRTGDIGRMIGGRLTITDRKKDIIIRGGENISSKEVEDVLASHPAVAAVAAFAIPHPRLGETICVAVTPVAGHSLTQEQVRAHFLLAGSARQKMPERLEIIAELPRTASGKIKKHELRARFATRDTV